MGYGIELMGLIAGLIHTAPQGGFVPKMKQDEIHQESRNGSTTRGYCGVSEDCIMTDKDFFQAISNSHTDIIKILLDILHSGNIGYCVIGGLAVNTDADSVVSLGLDIVVITSQTSSSSGALHVLYVPLGPVTHSAKENDRVDSS